MKRMKPSGYPHFRITGENKDGTRFETFVCSEGSGLITIYDDVMRMIDKIYLYDSKWIKIEKVFKKEAGK